jgi:hypothetical protein
MARHQLAKALSDAEVRRLAFCAGRLNGCRVTTGDRGTVSDVGSNDLSTFLLQESKDLEWLAEASEWMLAQRSQ